VEVSSCRYGQLEIAILHGDLEQIASWVEAPRSSSKRPWRKGWNPLMWIFSHFRRFSQNIFRKVFYGIDITSMSLDVWIQCILMNATSEYFFYITWWYIFKCFTVFTCKYLYMHPQYIQWAICCCRGTRIRIILFFLYKYVFVIFCFCLLNEMELFSPISVVFLEEFS
jgi:hypothetical protein